MTFIPVMTAPRHPARHWHPAEVNPAKLLEWLGEPGSDKHERGGYLFGKLKKTDAMHDGKKCTRYHRTGEALLSRSAVTLDADTPGKAFKRRLREALAGVTYVIHTTFSSTPDKPRYRVIIPLSREITPNEYAALAGVIVRTVGAGDFDSSTTEPVREMFYPAASDREHFWARQYDGPLLVPDTWLDGIEVPADPAPKRKRDPLELVGIAGSFNRTYTDFGELVEAYEIPYERASGRWRLVGAVAEAGVNQVAPGLWFSHHSSDPAAGHAASAFDLVRIHRFGHLDENAKPGTPVNRLPSTIAMSDLAALDARVIADMVGDDFDDKGESWRLGFVINSKTGEPKDCIKNLDLIRENDPVFSLIRFNDMSLNIETSGDLPWRPLSDGVVFTGVDRANLGQHIERTYGLRLSRATIDDLADISAHRNRYSPLRDYLDSLEWDGVERLEECLPGVIPTPYTRLVARRIMCAAVARVLEPGIKADHTLVIQGDEGLGKSFWIEKMALGYSASLGRIGDKDTLLAMRRSWIMVADEGHSMRKTDADMLKEFLTRTTDVFRMPFDRETMAHKRHTVIWSTINDKVFLRQQQGNRRFLVVQSVKPVDFDTLTDDYIGQVWAEAVSLWRSGERLHLTRDEAALAGAERERFVEEDALAGLLTEHLERLVPSGWSSWGPHDRARWLADDRDGMADEEGSERQMETCSASLWAEALGRPVGAHRRVDLIEITDAMHRIPGWEALPGRHRVPGLGPQLVFRRTGE